MNIIPREISEIYYKGNLVYNNNSSSNTPAIKVGEDDITYVYYGYEYEGFAYDNLIYVDWMSVVDYTDERNNYSTDTPEYYFKFNKVIYRKFYNTPNEYDYDNGFSCHVTSYQKTCNEYTASPAYKLNRDTIGNLYIPYKEGEKNTLTIYNNFNSFNITLDITDIIKWYVEGSDTSIRLAFRIDNSGLTHIHYYNSSNSYNIPPSYWTNDFVIKYFDDNDKNKFFITVRRSYLGYQFPLRIELYDGNTYIDEINFLFDVSSDDIELYDYFNIDTENHSNYNLKLYNNGDYWFKTINILNDDITKNHLLIEMPPRNNYNDYQYCTFTLK